MRHGFTLPEALLVAVLVGLLAALGAPRVAAFADRAAAARAAERIAVAHRRARAVALAADTPVRLILHDDSLVARTLDTGAVVWRAPGPAADGATLAPSPDSLVYAPNGFAVGAANARHVLRRGGATAEVTVSRLGRVRVLRIAP